MSSSDEALRKMKEQIMQAVRRSAEGGEFIQVNDPNDPDAVVDGDQLARHFAKMSLEVQGHASDPDLENPALYDETTAFDSTIVSDAEMAALTTDEKKRALAIVWNLKRDRAARLVNKLSQEAKAAKSTAACIRRMHFGVAVRQDEEGSASGARIGLIQIADELFVMPPDELHRLATTLQNSVQAYRKQFGDAVVVPGEIEALIKASRAVYRALIEDIYDDAEDGETRSFGEGADKVMATRVGESPTPGFAKRKPLH